MRGVVSTTVNSVNGVLAGWLQTHISNKVLKRIYPSIANLNTETAIVFIVGSIGVGASGFHSTPRIKFRGISHPVGCQSFNGGVSSLAPAGSRVTTVKVRSGADSSIPTSAKTNPSNWFCGMKFNNSKSIEFLTGKVFEFRHNILHTMLTMIKYVATCMETGVRVACPSHKLIITYNRNRFGG